MVRERPPSPTRASRGGESRPGAEPLSPADPTEARAAARRTGIRDALPPPQLRRAPGHKFAPRWPSCEWGASPGSGVSVRLLARAGPGMAGPGASPHVWGWLLLGGCLLVEAQVRVRAPRHLLPGASGRGVRETETEARWAHADTSGHTHTHTHTGRKKKREDNFVMVVENIDCVVKTKQNKTKTKQKTKEKEKS